MDGRCLLYWTLLNDAVGYFFTILCTSVCSLFVGETVRDFCIIFILTLGFYFISEPLTTSPQVSICGN